MKEGESNVITMKFEANPMPNDGFWTIHGLESPLALGAASLDGQYTSSFVDPSEVRLIIDPIGQGQKFKSFLILFSGHPWGVPSELDHQKSVR